MVNCKMRMDEVSFVHRKMLINKKNSEHSMAYVAQLKQRKTDMRLDGS